MCGDQSADVFGNLGNDGVTEGGHAGWLQFGGNPISHSTAVAIGRQEPVKRIKPRTRRSVSGLYRPPFLPSPQPRRPIEAVGVGHKEQAGPHMWGTHGARGEQTPLRIEPEAGQVTEYPPEGVGVVKQSWDVFHDDVPGS